MKEQEAKVLLGNLEIKTPLSKIPLLNVIFECNSIKGKNEWNFEYVFNSGR